MLDRYELGSEATELVCAGVPQAAAEAVPKLALSSDLAAYLDRVERDILEAALQRYRCNRTAAAARVCASLYCQMRYPLAPAERGRAGSSGPPGWRVRTRRNQLQGKHYP